MSEWISVDVSTPSKMDDEISIGVLTYDTDGNVTQACIEYATGDWLDRDGDEVYHVRYWQPLPLPPQ